jgi:hypothetical protein
MFISAVGLQVDVSLASQSVSLQRRQGTPGRCRPGADYTQTHGRHFGGQGERGSQWLESLRA